MLFSYLKKEKAIYAHPISIILMTLFLSNTTFAQEAKRTDPSSTEKTISVGTTIIHPGNSTNNDSSKVSTSINNFEEIELYLENFVKDVDDDFALILKSERSSPDSEFLRPYTRNLIKTDFPTLWKQLNTFFSQGNGCMWFYICEKDKPYGGTLIYTYKMKDLYNDGGSWGLTNYLFRGALNENVIYIRNIIDENLALKKGYIWYNDEKIFVRPRQLFKVLTGKCVYLFGFGDSPIYDDPDSVTPIKTYVSDDLQTTKDQK